LAAFLLKMMTKLFSSWSSD